MERYTIDLILWFVVFPLILFVLACINKAIYQAYKRRKDDHDMMGAAARYRNQEQITRESWHKGQ